MGSACYVIRLNGAVIDGNDVSCLGRQLVLIVDALGEEANRWVWFAQDIDAYHDLPAPLSRDSAEFQEIGTTEEMKQLAKAVDQLLSGTFVAILDDSNGILPCSYQKDTNHVLLELYSLIIVAFDTSYYEICSRNKQLLERLSQRFGVDLDHHTGQIDW